ncbi:3-deoxy-7-phosphoheptulonate synthase [Trinickia sp.]|uniref:3-deoxy-7-phosphoheptulonate synthase n=1 Tax=Trinickia sp. TaxID=2571163 RepID=UPI003F7CF602
MNGDHDPRSADYGGRIADVAPLPSPAELSTVLPGAAAADTVERARRALGAIVAREDDRLALVVGPCSIHDVDAALAYAEKIAALRRVYADDVEIVMRTYFEKPRTIDGWKGLLNDPLLDGSGDVRLGLRLARRLLIDINLLGVPAATEFLEPAAAHFLSDLVAWGAIGARTAESQIHRQLASGLPCPIGFKNGTDGNVTIAADALAAASRPHQFLSVSPDGTLAAIGTTGNAACHLVLRGGKEPNYDAQSIAQACAALAQRGLPERVVIDASHGNSRKRHANQLLVCDYLARIVAEGNAAVVGVMIESNLVDGRQDLRAGCELVYGQSITDACIGWADTERVVEQLALAVRHRRTAGQARRTRLGGLPNLETLVNA